MSLRPAEADRGSRDAAIMLGLTLPTDTVLYLLLPLEAAVFGVSLAEAGVLLAANRLVRIVGYGWVARLHHRQGARVCSVAAVLAAAASSFGYAVAESFWLLLLARLMWGLAFASMNITTQALATAAPEGASRRSGRARAIIAAGPTIGLLAGAALTGVIGPRMVFVILGAVALLALPFALRLPEERSSAMHAGGPRFGLPARLDAWSFVQGMILDGLFIMGLSVLAAAAMPDGAALAAGAALALRYAAEIVLGPAGGAIGERHGPRSRPSSSRSPLPSRSASRRGCCGCRRLLGYIAAGVAVGPYTPGFVADAAVTSAPWRRSASRCCCSPSGCISAAATCWPSGASRCPARWRRSRSARCSARAVGRGRCSGSASAAAPGLRPGAGDLLHRGRHPRARGTRAPVGGAGRAARARLARRAGPGRGAGPRAAAGGRRVPAEGGICRQLGRRRWNSRPSRPPWRSAAAPARLLAACARGSRELFTLAVVVALGVAFGASSLFGVSFALGAFFAGVLLGESDVGHQAAAETTPLQRIFAAIFFVSVGMLVDPARGRRALAPRSRAVSVLLGTGGAICGLLLRCGCRPAPPPRSRRAWRRSASSPSCW
jgi:hypothetical protein